jgi:hypothetical protein
MVCNRRRRVRVVLGAKGFGFKTGDDSAGIYDETQCAVSVRGAGNDGTREATSSRIRGSARSSSNQRPCGSAAVRSAQSCRVPREWSITNCAQAWGIEHTDRRLASSKPFMELFHQRTTGEHFRVSWPSTSEISRAERESHCCSRAQAPYRHWLIFGGEYHYRRPPSGSYRRVIVVGENGTRCQSRQDWSFAGSDALQAP